MIINFTELRVQNGQLIIAAEVGSESYYNNVHIDSIIIDTQDTFTGDDKPSSKKIYTYPVSEGQKSCRISLSSQDLTNVDIDNTLFFVFVKTTGTPDPSTTPCGGDKTYTLGVTFSLCPIYNRAMEFIKGIENSCEIPKAFIDMILRLKAVQYSIDSGHFIQAIKYYKRFFKGITATGSSSNCGCHG